MKKNIIEVGDVRYSKLSHTLSFTVACNPEAIQMVEDAAYRNDMTPEEIAEEARKMLQSAILMAYNRGGLRRKYD